MQITAQRWPWQKGYGFRDNKHLGRFGGGRRWSLGIEAGGRTILFNLLFGQIRITWGKSKAGHVVGY